MWKALGQMPKVHVLHMWHIHTQVQQRVMGQLLKLATASDDIKEMVANHGGLVQVLQGMQGHPRNNGIQRAGTDLLRCLAFTPRIRHLIADAGAIHVCVCVCVCTRAARVYIRICMCSNTIPHQCVRAGGIGAILHAWRCHCWRPDSLPRHHYVPRHHSEVSPYNPSEPADKAVALADMGGVIKASLCGSMLHSYMYVHAYACMCVCVCVCMCSVYIHVYMNIYTRWRWRTRG